MSRSRSSWPTPSSTSGRAGSPASAAWSVKIPLAEAVEVADRHPRGRRDTDGLLQPLAQFGGCLNVVCQDQQVLGHEALTCLEQPAHTLDDDACLAGTGAGDHYGRPLVPFDDAALLCR